MSVLPFLLHRSALPSQPALRDHRARTDFLKFVRSGPAALRVPVRDLAPHRRQARPVLDDAERGDRPRPSLRLEGDEGDEAGQRADGGGERAPRAAALGGRGEGAQVAPDDRGVHAAPWLLGSRAPDTERASSLPPLWAAGRWARA
jgi:hypothetical protein